MKLSAQNDSAALPDAGRRPSRSNRRRLLGLSAAATALFATAAVACSNGNDDAPDAAPSASAPASNWPGNGDPATEEFRKHLAQDEAAKDLLAISMHAITEQAGPPASIRIITNLDRELRDSDSPDVPKAEKVAKAFVDWHSREYNDHGTVKISNPATETLTTRSW
ncbi:hypothetical protein ACFWB2_30005 [Streptomyces virginiae]|uniref:hypothetical protein n=1 Tax=Streptomyces virginiae TaxID=1961 RepID=UPI00367CF904